MATKLSLEVACNVFSAWKKQLEQAQPDAVWRFRDSMSRLAEFLLQRADLPESEIAWLAERAEERSLARGEAFCSVGQTAHELGFVESGILQVYAPSPDGRTALLDFLFPGSVALALDAAIKGSAAEVVFEAITQCVIKVWPYRIREDAEARHSSWTTLGLRMTEDMLVRKQHRYLSLRQWTARERYANLARELPYAWRQIPQHLIAAYLDITPQYLSRLRNEPWAGIDDEPRARAVQPVIRA